MAVKIFPAIFKSQLAVADPAPSPSRTQSQFVCALASSSSCRPQLPPSCRPYSYRRPTRRLTRPSCRRRRHWMNYWRQNLQCRLPHRFPDKIKNIDKLIHNHDIFISSLYC